MGKSKILLFLLILFLLSYTSMAAIPTIYNIVNTSLNATKTEITWSTDELTNSTLFYGTTSGSYPSSISNTSYTTSHNISLAALSVNTTYFYYINSTTAIGESNISNEYNFTTPYQDLVSPTVFIISPYNNTFLRTDLLINSSTNEQADCYYSIEDLVYDIPMDQDGNYHSAVELLPDGIYNITVNCTDLSGLSTQVKSFNVTMDTLDPDLEIFFPWDEERVTGLKVEVDFDLYETNIDKVWYTENLNATKNIIANINNAGNNLKNITFDYPGKENLYLYANDSAGNLYSTNVTFYIDDFLNITAWQQDFLNYASDALTAEAFNSTFMKETGNITLGNISLEINFTSISVDIYNLTSSDTAWSRFFNAEDSSATFESTINTNYGSYPEDYVVFYNFSGFHNDTNDYYARVKFPNNISAYDSVYFCPTTDLSVCEIVSSCTDSSYSETTTAACYNSTDTNLFVYMPHLGSVFLTNDTQAPIITFTSPENNTVLTSSYLNGITFTTNENATCGISVNSTGTYTSLNGIARTTFSSNFSSYFNRYHNLTANCTDTYGNSALSTIYFRINDTTMPTISITVTGYTTGIRFSLTTNEPANSTVTIGGVSTKTNSTFALTHTENFTGLTEATTYNYTVIVCDALLNCRNTSSTKKTSTSSSSTSTGSTGSTVGSNTTTGVVKVTQIWQSPEAGDYTLNIPTSNIAITQIKIELKNDVSGDILFTIEKITTLPPTMTSLTRPYQYMKVEKTRISDANITNILFKFRVEKSWITANNINPDTIALYRYTTQWIKLATIKKSSDSAYYYYEADSPGMSYFGIQGELNVQPPQTQVQQPNPLQNTQPDQTDQEGLAVSPDTAAPSTVERDSDTAKAGSTFPLIAGIVVFAIIVSGILIFMTSQQKPVVIIEKKQKTPEDSIKELDEYIQKCKSEGILFKEIKDSLLNAGWKESVVDDAMSKIDVPKTDMDRIKSYVVEMKKYNKTNEEIKAGLKSVGWQEEVIEEIFPKK